MLAPSLDLELAKAFVLGWLYPLWYGTPSKNTLVNPISARITAIHE